MAGVNKVTILGNLGSDPEIRYLPNGDIVARLSIATSRAWKDKVTGSTKELTEWHQVIFYRRLAEITQQYLVKGDQVYLEGYLKTHKWTDKNNIERWTTQIIGEVLNMIGSKHGSSPSPTQPTQEQEVQGDTSNNGAIEAEIPF